MLKRQTNGNFERLPNIRDTVINGSLLLTFNDQNNRKSDQKIGYEQGKESKIYKRTRMNVGSPRNMKKWPASLLLSGKNVFDPNGGNLLQSPTANVNVANPETETDLLPPIEDKLLFLEPSKSFYSDFGLRTHNTDTFSGYRNARTKKHRSTSFVEKEIEKKAMRHIHAIQVLSNSKRGSYAIRSVNSLKETLSPVRSNSEMIPTSYVRSEINSSTDKNPSFLDVSKRAPYNLLVRTRDNNRIMSRRGDPLPEISGRTVLGFDTKYSCDSTVKDFA